MVFQRCKVRSQSSPPLFSGRQQTFAYPKTSLSASHRNLDNVAIDNLSMHWIRRPVQASVYEPNDLVAVRTALQDAGIDYESAEASFQPSVTVPVDLDAARKVLRLVDALEDSDDVQEVYTNIDIPDDVAAQLDEE